jgi:hypothetical protein
MGNLFVNVPRARARLGLMGLLTWLRNSRQWHAA